MVGQCRWHCPTCNTRRDASKWIELWKLPTYLIIHLKRLFRLSFSIVSYSDGFIHCYG